VRVLLAIFGISLVAWLAIILLIILVVLALRRI
jgi:hypothetical protein